MASSGFVTVKLVHDPKDASGAPLNCADVFVILKSDTDDRTTWTDSESGTFWPRDLVPNDPELKDLCRVWVLTMQEVDEKFECFQHCIPLQNFGAGSLNAIDRHITSDPESASGKPTEPSDEQKPNNGVVILVGHGLGGVLAEMISSLILELPVEVLRGHHLGLKRKHWRLVVLGTPHLEKDGHILEDLDQIKALVTYYGGSDQGCDVHHTRQFWSGMHQHSQCLVDNDWERRELQAPADPHGTLKVASFQEGVEDEELAEQMRSMRPNHPENNGFVVQPRYSLFGGKALFGLTMADPPSPVLPSKHRTLGQFKDENDQGYLSLRAVLKEFAKADKSVA